jgi:hypothetical protein
MMSRRNFLIAGISMAGIAALARNLFAPGRARSECELLTGT